MGTQPIAIVVASGLGRLPCVKTVDKRAGISVRSAIGTRRLMPGKSTEPLGKGSIGMV